MIRKLMLSVMQRYTKRFFAVHPEVKLIVVAGSIGKTSVKRAIGTVLTRRFRVRMHETELTDPLGVYLSILGIDIPKNGGSVLFWLKAIAIARYQVKHPPVIDVVIQELVLDKPGAFSNYEKVLNPTIAVITSVNETREDVFKTIDAVASEELAASNIADFVLINRDDIASEFAAITNNANFNTYGNSGSAEYRVEMKEFDRISDIPAQFIAPELAKPVPLSVNFVGEHQMRPLAAASAVALKLGLNTKDIAAGISSVVPLPGRLRPLRGLEEAIILDDTWSIDPDSLIAGLQTMYHFDSVPQRIAVIGSMSTLGGSTEESYQRVAEALDSSLLSWVVLVGDTSAQYLAPLARSRGCQAKACKDAIEAAEFVRSVSEQGALILVKGGENDLMEEAVKILVDVSEYPHLVRQSPEWLARNQEVFARFADK